MSTQVYRCSNPKHGEFEMTVPFGADVSETAQCPESVTCALGYEHPCPATCMWVPSAPNFIGGPTTGAQNK